MGVGVSCVVAFQSILELLYNNCCIYCRFICVCVCVLFQSRILNAAVNYTLTHLHTAQIVYGHCEILVGNQLSTKKERIRKGDQVC